MAPTDSTDVYPVTDVIYQKGGYLSVANAAARLAITTERRSLGMLVREEDTGSVYMLIGGIADINWTAQAVMSSGAALMTSGNVVSIVSGMALPSGVYQVSGVYQASGSYAGSGDYWVVTSGQAYVTSGLSLKQVSGMYQTSGDYLLTGWAQASGVYLNSGDVIANNSGTTLLSMSGVTATSGVHTCTSGGTLNTLVSRPLVPGDGVSYVLSGECIRVNADQVQVVSMTVMPDGDDNVVANGDIPMFLVPPAMNGWYLTQAVAKVHSKCGNGSTDVQIRMRNDATDDDMLTNLISIGTADYYGAGTVTTAGSHNQVATGAAFYADVDAVGSAAVSKGLVVSLTFVR